MRKFISFCFDDGFLASSTKVRRLFDDRKIKASFCVLAQPSDSIDPAHSSAIFGDWTYWREVQASGHEVAPHGWAHERLNDMPLELVKLRTNKMFDRFGHELSGFSSGQSIYHTAYLALPGDVQTWLLTRVKAVRVATDLTGENSFAAVAKSGVVNCSCSGPDDVAEKTARRLAGFQRSGSDWLVVVLHGLDGEGWGSIAADDLAVILDMCMNSGIEIVPTAHIFDRFVQRM